MVCVYEKSHRHAVQASTELSDKIGTPLTIHLPLSELLSPLPPNLTIIIIILSSNPCYHLYAEQLHEPRIMPC